MSDNLKLTDLPGIGLSKAQALEEAGFGTIEALQAANESDLSSVPGISENLALKIKEAVQNLVQESAPVDAPPEPIPADQIDDDLLNISGITPARADSLREAGFETADDLENASQDQLSSVEGISTALAARIKASLGDIDLEEKAASSVASSTEDTPDDSTPTELRPRGHAQKLPELDPEEKRLLSQKQREGKPTFNRQDGHKKKRLTKNKHKSVWRRPRGTHSKQRRRRGGHGEVVRSGYRTPVSVRGRHASGFKEVHVHRPEDLSDIDPTIEAIRIAASVGNRKRERIEDLAEENGIRVLNPSYEEVSLQ
jgi:large subunit ribosomal protein L32e